MTGGGGSANLGTVFQMDPAAHLPVAGLSFNPTTVMAGKAATGTVVLASPAPSGGQVVALGSDNPRAAQVPATITVSGGQISSTFMVTTSAWISATAKPTIFASVGGAGFGRIITVEPPPLLTSLALNPTTVKGGGTSTGTVTLSAAGAGDIVVSLSSSNPRKAKVPSTVTVLAGSSSATFTVKTSRTSSTRTVTISASFNGVTKTMVLTINP